jgi:hypothetical protein
MLWYSKFGTGIGGTRKLIRKLHVDESVRERGVKQTPQLEIDNIPDALVRSYPMLLPSLFYLSDSRSAIALPMAVEQRGTVHYFWLLSSNSFKHLTLPTSGSADVTRPREKPQ